jgi:hypothetical protein
VRSVPSRTILMVQVRVLEVGLVGISREVGNAHKVHYHLHYVLDHLHKDEHMGRSEDSVTLVTPANGKRKPQQK